jgi:membrane associated rhomboid family serine protease
MFLHGPNPMHILFNMLILWMFGPEIERILGSRRFVCFYFFSGLGAGLCSLVISPHSPYPVMGASGAMYALMLAFAIYYPNRYLLLFFFIPIKAKYLVAGTILLEIYFSVLGVQDGIAHVAHLGGLFFGFIFLKRKTILPDLRYHYLRLKGNWYRRKFKIHTGGRSRRDDNGWMH